MDRSSGIGMASSCSSPPSLVTGLSLPDQKKGMKYSSFRISYNKIFYYVQI